jgi:hypothetical protein
MKPLRVEFDMTPEDLVAGAQAFADRDPGVRKTRRNAQRVLAVVILILAAFVAIDFALHTPPVYTLSMGCLGGATVAMVLRFPNRRSWGEVVRKQATSMLASPAGKACLGPRSVEVNHDGIALASGFARTLVTWRGVIDVISTADYQVIILPGPVCLPVPRRAFDTDHDFEQFGETVTELATAGGGLTGRVPPL